MCKHAYGLKKKDEVIKLLKETHKKSDSEEPVLKQENISTMVSCGNWLFPKLSFYDQNKLETKFKCQLSTEATCHVLSYRDLLIIKQDGNPWKLAKPSLLNYSVCLMATWWSLLAKSISKSYMVESHNNFYCFKVSSHWWNKQ